MARSLTRSRGSALMNFRMSAEVTSVAFGEFWAATGGAVRITSMASIVKEALRKTTLSMTAPRSEG